MAAITKTTSTLNVLIQDSNNGDVTFKLDNPKNGISLQDVKDKFNIFDAQVAPGQYENLLCTKAGYDLISVIGAEKITTTVTKETLD